MPTVGIVSPGAMGSAIAAALARGGVRVVATVAGRSERTVLLAKRAKIELLPDLDAVVRAADIVLSIVPPEAAAAVVESVVRSADDQATQPLIVDLNAIASGTARRIETVAADSGHELVDGSISGPPPWESGTTRVYLSGRRAAEIAALTFDGVERIVVSDEVGAASAVKMSTASVYKGSTALLAQALLAADTNGVLEHVLADLRSGAPELVSRVGRRLATAASKSGRYVGEMHEIAATQSAAGLTPALFEAIAEIYATLARTPGAMKKPEEITAGESLEQVLADIREV